MAYPERIESYKEEMLKTLGELVAIPSVNSDAVKNQDGELMPFGRNVHDAMLYMLNKGRELGFDVYNDENYACHIEWKAPEGGDGYFGIVGHIDVMPEGTGWTGDPFVMTEKDGYVYGRGVSDDKGPVVAGLYALKALKDEGIVPKQNIRLVLGLNEESGSESADHYTANCGHPDAGFTPDGRFPLVNGEMGILVFDLAQKFNTKPAKDDLRLTKLEGGTAHNAVPAAAKAVIAGSKEQYDLITERAKLYKEETGYEIRTKKQGSSLVAEAQGLAAHGARPELGLNAVSILMDFLGRINFANEELNEFIAFYNDNIGFDLHGERMNCDFEDGPSGPLIFNVGVANINEEIASISVNIRFPVTNVYEEIISGVEKTLEGSRIGVVIKLLQPPVYRNTEDPMVTKMVEVYREETGDNESQPMTTGGGTYAKMFNNILCYGALFPGEENTMHQADEKFSTDSLMKMAQIYAKTVFALCCE